MGGSRRSPPDKPDRNEAQSHLYVWKKRGRGDSMCRATASQQQKGATPLIFREIDSQQQQRQRRKRNERRFAAWFFNLSRARESPATAQQILFSCSPRAVYWPRCVSMALNCFRAPFLPLLLLFC